ncbi:polysaccharide pyruvyl transferase family protein [Microbulbifer hainanensis]|uniref:polysaccharide pyruvyl transferase family protein n=1 Tax=Microbulbifer hainanensis TaxID=2735675 RepID=UPI001869499A|nr:polysaccharide pyruvyl transferase family protein [Microbulbifer hainanensis]
MRIGLITNLIHEKVFIENRLAFGNSKDWMTATGGNTGNVAFVEGIKSILGGKVQAIHWGDNPESINQHLDHIVVCCANQLGTHADLSGWADRLSKFQLPTTFIGIGAQADRIGEIPDLPEGTVKFLEVASSLRSNPNHSNIVTRGAFSSSVISHYGYTSNPFGCPSQFISPMTELGQLCIAHQKKRKNKRILTAAGNPFHPSGIIENKLVEIVGKFNGEYVIQHPKVLFDLASQNTGELTDAQIKAVERAYSSLGKLSDILDWFSANAVSFADAQNWMQFSKKFSQVIGPRYHGIALPIQVGVPGKVISIDSRTEELANTTGVPYISYKDASKLSAAELIEASAWSQRDADHYDDIRNKNARFYSEFLEAQGLPISDHLKILVEEEKN